MKWRKRAERGGGVGDGGERRHPLRERGVRVAEAEEWELEGEKMHFKEKE